MLRTDGDLHATTHATAPLPSWLCAGPQAMVMADRDIQRSRDAGANGPLQAGLALLPAVIVLGLPKRRRSLKAAFQDTRTCGS